MAPGFFERVFFGEEKAVTFLNLAEKATLLIVKLCDLGKMYLMTETTAKNK